MLVSTVFDRNSFTGLPHFVKKYKEGHLKRGFGEEFGEGYYRGREAPES